MADSILDSLWSLVTPREAEAKVLPLDDTSAAVLKRALAGNDPLDATRVTVPTEVQGSLEDTLSRYGQGRKVYAGNRYPNVPAVPGHFQVDPFKKTLYQALAQQAERDPRAVTVRYGKTQSPAAAADYLPSGQAVTLSVDQLGDLPPDDPRVQEGFAHELMHFLLKGGGGYRRMEHPLIKYVLGTDMAGETPQLAMESRPFTASQHPSAVLRDFKDRSPADSGGVAPQVIQQSLETMTPAVRDALLRLWEGTRLEHGVWQRND